MQVDVVRQVSHAVAISRLVFWLTVDPTAAPPSLFRLAAVKSGWRAVKNKPGWRRRQYLIHL